MGRYVARRMVGLVPTIAMLLFFVVALIHLIPGDIIDLMLEQSGTAPDNSSREQLTHEMGLDRPLFVRYLEYGSGLLHGDLGQSLWTDKPVLDLVRGAASVTSEIGALSIVIGAALGIAIGTISAVRQDTPLDFLLRGGAILGVSLPSFVTATLVVVFPAIWFGKGLTLRYVAPSEDLLGNLKIIVPPAIVLGIGLSASLMRLTRTMMLEVLRQDYIRTAHAKGVPAHRVIVGHALKNALIPVITVLGLQVAALISGSVIIEAVFALPGLGRLLLFALSNRDYPVVQGVVVILGLFVMTVNLLIDMSYAWFDPRIRYT